MIESIVLIADVGLAEVVPSGNWLSVDFQVSAMFILKGSVVNGDEQFI